MGVSRRGQFSVLGSTGYIGRELVRYLEEQDNIVATPCPDEWLEGDLGNVIYCVGVTSDFRERPLDVVEGHITLPFELMRHARFDSFLYLSSTRVYERKHVGREGESAEIRSENLEDIYNASKVMGESLCVHSGRPGVRVVRLSNVIGGRDQSSNFLISIIRDALSKGEINLRTSADSAKDYVHIDDVVRVLPRIAERGRHTIYNVAGGRNITHREILDGIAKLTGCTIVVQDDAPKVTFPMISIDRVKSEFDFCPRSVLECLPDIVSEIKERYIQDDQN